MAETGVEVSPGPVSDGLGARYRERVAAPVEAEINTTIQHLKDSGAEVVVNYLPVGSNMATRMWARIAIQAGCAFVNCIPEWIANDADMRMEFVKANLPLIGDDIKSQFGATILHRVLTRLLRMKGMTLKRTYQLNFGGNMDFYNMLNDERLKTKKASKRGSVEAELDGAPAADIHISPTDHIAWLEDRKWCYIRCEAEAFGGSPLNLEVKLEVWDSPNSAGVVTDCIRLAKLALSAGEGGPIHPACQVNMKSPPEQQPDEAAIEELEQWIASHSLLLAKPQGVTD